MSVSKLEFVGTETPNSVATKRFIRLPINFVKTYPSFGRCEEYDACGGRLAMVHDISTLRTKVLLHPPSHDEST